MNFPNLWYGLVVLSMIALGLALFYWRRVWIHRPRRQFEQARELFQRQRPQLERAFFEVASVSGKPRGLRWKECQWSKLIEWVRDKQTSQLLALAGVTISFEAIEGGDMEGVEAVGNLRNASVVFFFQDGEWRTAGRVVFNLNPDEAVKHFQENYVRVAE